MPRLASSSPWTQHPLAAAIAVSLIVIGTEVAFSHPDLLGGLRCPCSAETTGTVRAISKSLQPATRGNQHTLSVRYTYEVNGTKYIGSRYRWNSDQMSSDDADSLIAELPPGKTVPVFYDPDAPQSAVLDPSSLVPAPAVRWTIEAAVLGFLWIGGLLAMRRR